MPTLDKRFSHRIKEKQAFYLFKKHSLYYYAYYPEYNTTKSTRQVYIRDAYYKAYEIYESFTSTKITVFKELERKKENTALKYVLKFLPSNTTILTSRTIENLQKTLLETGKSGKTVNDYIYILRKSYTGVFPSFEALKHTAVYRKCFPISSFYHYWSKNDNSRLFYLSFFAMTTGVRLGEIKNSYPVEVNGKLYLQIDGTKTSNAVRKVPLLPETRICYEKIQGGFRSAAYKESVVLAGKLVGFDEKYIEENNIVFHSFRKMYKTLLTSCNLSDTWVEYYIGHSQTRTMSALYFIGDSADDSEIYSQIIEALRRFL